MIPIQLPSGRTVFITFEESLDDNFLQELIARNEGYEIENPFDPKIDKIREDSLWDVPEAPEITEAEAKKMKLGKDKD